MAATGILLTSSSIGSSQCFRSRCVGLNRVHLEVLTGMNTIPGPAPCLTAVRLSISTACIDRDADDVVNAGNRRAAAHQCVRRGVWSRLLRRRCRPLIPRSRNADPPEDHEHARLVHRLRKSGIPSHGPDPLLLHPAHPTLRPRCLAAADASSARLDTAGSQPPPPRIWRALRWHGVCLADASASPTLQDVSVTSRRDALTGLVLSAGLLAASPASAFGFGGPSQEEVYTEDTVRAEGLE